MVHPPQLRGVEALIVEWERSARSAFVNAERYEAGSMERRAIEHGAMCYRNCAAALKEAIGDGRRDGKCPSCGSGTAEWQWLESTAPSWGCLDCGALASDQAAREAFNLACLSAGTIEVADAPDPMS